MYRPPDGLPLGGGGKELFGLGSSAAACPWILGDFLYLWIFSFIGGGGGTDIEWNQPRRCVWVVAVFS